MKGKHVKVKKIKLGTVLVPILLVGTILVVNTKMNQKSNKNNSYNENIINESPVNKVGESEEITDLEELEIETPEIIEEEKETEKPKEEEKEIEKATITSIDGLEIEHRKVVKATNAVNVRSEANTDCEIYDVLYKGNTLNLIYQENEDWYKVDYEGKEAYVSSKYSEIVEKNKINSPIQKIGYLKNDASIYSNINESNSIQELPKLEVTPIYGEIEDYYLTAIDDTVGYISKENVGILEGTFAIVDISDQTAYLYENNELILSTPVVTGKNSTPTTKGLHEVWLMEKDRYLTGQNYSVPVKVVAFFCKGEGFHDASWRSAFGGEIYKNNGSHGCVNMPKKAALEFYQNLEVGDKVLVKQ